MLQYTIYGTRHVGQEQDPGVWRTVITETLQSSLDVLQLQPEG